MEANNGRAQELARGLGEAIRSDRIDEADALLTELKEACDDPQDLMLFDVVIAVQRGQAREALRMLEESPEDRHPELRALCLYMLDEPHWEGCAAALLESDDLVIRSAMRQLLGRAVEEDTPA